MDPLEPNPHTRLEVFDPRRIKITMGKQKKKLPIAFELYSPYTDGNRHDSLSCMWDFQNVVLGKQGGDVEESRSKFQSKKRQFPIA